MQYVSETAQTTAFSRKVLQALGFYCPPLKVPKKVEHAVYNDEFVSLSNTQQRRLKTLVMGKVKMRRPNTFIYKGILNRARNLIHFKPHHLSWKMGRMVWKEVKGVSWLSSIKLFSYYFKSKCFWILVDEDDDGFNLIQPSLIQQLKTILDQYPDDGQILKVRNVEGLIKVQIRILTNSRFQLWDEVHFRSDDGDDNKDVKTPD